MSNAARVVVIGLGLALLVVLFIPLLLMSGMMGAMMGGGGMTWGMGSLALLVLLAGGALLAVGLRQRS